MYVQMKKSHCIECEAGAKSGMRSSRCRLWWGSCQGDVDDDDGIYREHVHLYVKKRIEDDRSKSFDEIVGC